MTPKELYAEYERYHTQLLSFLKNISKSRKAKKSAIIDYINIFPTGTGYLDYSRNKDFGGAKLIKSILKFNTYIHFSKDNRFSNDIIAKQAIEDGPEINFMKDYPEKTYYDFVLCLLDYNTYRHKGSIYQKWFGKNHSFKTDLKTSFSNAEILLINALHSLTPEGILFTKLTKDYFFEGGSNVNFIKLLDDRGFYCNFFSIGWFNDWDADDGRKGDTLLVGFERKKMKKSFVSVLPKGGIKNVRVALDISMKLDKVEPEKIIANFLSGESENIYRGIWLKELNLASIYLFQFNERKRRLSSKYAAILHNKISNLIDDIIPTVADGFLDLATNSSGEPDQVLGPEDSNTLYLRMFWPEGFHTAEPKVSFYLESDSELFEWIKDRVDINNRADTSPE